MRINYKVNSLQGFPDNLFEINFLCHHGRAWCSSIDKTYYYWMFPMKIYGYHQISNCGFFIIYRLTCKCLSVWITAASSFLLLDRACRTAPIITFGKPAIEGPLKFWPTHCLCIISRPTQKLQGWPHHAGLTVIKEDLVVICINLDFGKPSETILTSQRVHVAIGARNLWLIMPWYDYGGNSISTTKSDSFPQHRAFIFQILRATLPACIIDVNQMLRIFLLEREKRGALSTSAIVAIV